MTIFKLWEQVAAIRTKTIKIYGEAFGAAKTEAEAKAAVTEQTVGWIIQLNRLGIAFECQREPDIEPGDWLVATFRKVPKPTLEQTMAPPDEPAAEPLLTAEEAAHLKEAFVAFMPTSDAHTELSATILKKLGVTVDVQAAK